MDKSKSSFNREKGVLKILRRGGGLKFEYKCCVVTHREADCLLGLFTLARIACLLQLGIKTSELDYSIWATPK